MSKTLSINLFLVKMGGGKTLIESWLILPDKERRAA